MAISRAPWYTAGVTLGRRIGAGAAIGIVVVAVLATAGAASVALTQVSADPFTNTSSQHATEVEPDTFATARRWSRRTRSGGSSTAAPPTSAAPRSRRRRDLHPASCPGSRSRGRRRSEALRAVSDPSVAYDAAHDVWLISSIPLLPTTLVGPDGIRQPLDRRRPTRATRVRSAAGGPRSTSTRTGRSATTTPTSPSTATATRSSTTSPRATVEYMSTSTDGGLTWRRPISPAGKVKGLGGQPVVQPDGTVIVPFESLNGHDRAFRSPTAATLETKVHRLQDQLPLIAGGLRTSPLPTRRDRRGRQRLRGLGGLPLRAEVRRQRHRHQHVGRRRQLEPRSRASRSTRSAAASTTSSPASPSIRRPPEPAPHLALTYYYYPNAACTPATCELDVGYISSPDGGATWGAPTQLAGPMASADIAATSQGPMVGDYISTSFNATAP